MFYPGIGIVRDKKTFSATLKQRRVGEKRCNNLSTKDKSYPKKKVNLCRIFGCICVVALGSTNAKFNNIRLEIRHSVSGDHSLELIVTS